MLTLTRGIGERIIIGDDIIIEIRSILDGRQVRIGIEAPRNIRVHRAEHLEAVSEANIVAAATEQNRTVIVELARTGPGDGDAAGAVAPAPIRTRDDG